MIYSVSSVFVEFEDADQYHAREVYDGRDEYYDNYHSDYQDADFEQLFARVVRKQDVIERIQDTRPFKNSLQVGKPKFVSFNSFTAEFTQ